MARLFLSGWGETSTSRPGPSQLILANSRVAEINASDIQGPDQPGRERHVAELYVVGDTRKERRGLRDAAPPLA